MIQIFDKELANKVDTDGRVNGQILIWCVLVGPSCYNAIQADHSATVIVGEAGEG